jgi:hypothetical protein
MAAAAAAVGEEDHRGRARGNGQVTVELDPAGMEPDGTFSGNR